MTDPFPHSNKADLARQRKKLQEPGPNGVLCSPHAFDIASMDCFKAWDRAKGKIDAKKARLNESAVASITATAVRYPKCWKAMRDVGRRLFHETPVTWSGELEENNIEALLSAPSPASLVLPPLTSPLKPNTLPAIGSTTNAAGRISYNAASNADEASPSSELLRGTPVRPLSEVSAVSDTNAASSTTPSPVMPLVFRRKEKKQESKSVTHACTSIPRTPAGGTVITLPASHVLKASPSNQREHDNLVVHNDSSDNSGLARGSTPLAPRERYRQPREEDVVWADEFSDELLLKILEYAKHRHLDPLAFTRSFARAIRALSGDPLRAYCALHDTFDFNVASSPEIISVIRDYNNELESHRIKGTDSEWKESLLKRWAFRELRAPDRPPGLAELSQKLNDYVSICWDFNVWRWDDSHATVRFDSPLSRCDCCWFCGPNWF